MENQNTMLNLARPETKFSVKTLTGENMEFRIVHWKPTEVFSRIPLIGRYFYVPMSMLLSSDKSEVDFSEVIPAALIQLFNTMEHHNIVHFISEILDSVIYQNNPVMNNFDEVFMKNPDVVIELVAKVVEIHYSPFFKTGFSKLITSLMPAIKLNNN